jgi:hypothetical protein
MNQRFITICSKPRLIIVNAMGMLFNLYRMKLRPLSADISVYKNDSVHDLVDNHLTVRRSVADTVRTKNGLKIVFSFLRILLPILFFSLMCSYTAFPISNALFMASLFLMSPIPHAPVP